MAERTRTAPPRSEPELRLADLANTRRWVAWQTVDRKNRDGSIAKNKDGSIAKTKVPIAPHTGQRARIPTDPSTYGTRAEAEKRWAKIDDGEPGGMGIVLGDIDGVCLYGIDLDSCIDPPANGDDLQFAPWADEVLDRFDTYAEVSPSGTGVKLFFLGDPEWRDLLGKNTEGKAKTRLAFTAGTHQEMALDAARFYAVTEKRLDARPETFRTVSREDVAWFLEVAGPAFKIGPATQDKKDKTSSSPRDESGSGYGFRFMLDRKRGGDTYEAACAALQADPAEAGEWARRVDERQLRRAWDAAAAGYPPEVIEKIAELARLDRVSYDRARTQAKKDLGIQMSTLDALVDEQRARNVADDEVSTFMAPVAPWPQPVDGDKLLNDLCDTIERHLILPKYASEAMALWIFHAHAHDAARHSPILFATSPTKQCGKTNLLATLSMLVPKALSAANVTPATVFRAIPLWHPTLLIDESDTFISDKSELRGVLNSGHTKSQAYVLRCVGDDMVPTQFSTWAPKAFAAIGRLHPTLEDRSIKIELRRKLRTEKVDRIPSRDDAYAELRSKIARWAADHLDQLRDAKPRIPKALTDRGRDNWEPLLAIAEAVGGDWPSLAWWAARTLSKADDDETFAIVLLKDLKQMFDAEGDALSSTEIAAKLTAMEDRPWPEFKNGKPISTQGIARLLKPFKIFPHKLRIGGRQTNGYSADRFATTFKRYIPDEGGKTPHLLTFFSQINYLDEIWASPEPHRR